MLGHSLLNISAITSHYDYYTTKGLSAFDILPFKVTQFGLHEEI